MKPNVRQAREATRALFLLGFWIAGDSAQAIIIKSFHHVNHCSDCLRSVTSCCFFSAATFASVVSNRSLIASG